MIDHTGLIVSNIEISKKWYAQALKSIGYGILMEFSAQDVINSNSGVHVTAWAGIGEISTQKPDFWISEATATKSATNPPLHIAFRGRRSQVDQFYKDATAAGGKDNGKPGLRPHYHPDYYGAFVLDPDGNNIEVVCHDKVE